MRYIRGYTVSQWNFLIVAIIASVSFMLLSGALINLQLIEGSQYAQLADNNQVRLRYEYPNRGVIFDRNGKRLAENRPSVDLYVEISKYIDADGELDFKDLSADIQEVEKLLGDKGLNNTVDGESFDDLAKYIEQFYKKQDPAQRTTEILIASDLGSELTIKVKSAIASQPEGVFIISEGSKRHYPQGESLAHILGYTSVVTYEDLQVGVDYLGYESLVAANGYSDMLGRLGVEKVYDQYLIGAKGILATDKDAYNRDLYSSERELEEVVNGQNLHLSLELEAQKKMYEIVVAGIEKNGATAGVGIIQDVDNGELIAMVTAPGYDNNKFVGGISQKDYDKLLKDPQLPLFNRTISAQLPPGSTFKTLTAIAALESGAISPSTVYVSRSNYTFSNGAGFQEYRGNSYGPVNLESAISVSSNIYFCEVVRNSGIDGLVPYYEGFGIGELTGVDLFGEAAGRLPSPQNKIELANTPGITWLDPIWYPEGDGCNTVIGQGITLVTPIQMSNWIAAMANGGTLHTPHLGVKLDSGADSSKEIEYDVLNENFVGQQNLAYVRSSMRAAVAGSRRTIHVLTDAKVPVAAKTGTAEFGALNAQGQYEHTHAWVTGFFPYEDPKYSFVFLLEDGGESFNASAIAREYIDWFAENYNE